jgi:hypothetical protein
MNLTRILGLIEGASVVLMAGAWYRMSRERVVYTSWRNKASSAALVFVSVAVVIQFGLAMMTQFRPLATLDTASASEGWNAFAGHFWLWSFFATGLLAFAGLVLAALGKGTPRILAGVWSLVVLALFFVNLVLAVNSVH